MGLPQIQPKQAPLGVLMDQIDLNTGFLINGAPCNLSIDNDPDGNQVIRERWPRDGSAEATVRIKCYWFQRYQVVAGLKGTSIIAGGQVIRTPPFLYPDSPNLRCIEIADIMGIGPYRRVDNWLGYKYAVITAVFGWTPWGTTELDPQSQNDPSGEPFTTTKVRGNVEVMSPPGSTYYWLSGPDSGKPVESSLAGIIRPHAQISITRVQVPFMDLESMMGLMGTVNDLPVPLASRIFPRGTLLFVDFETEPVTDGAGNNTQNITYNYLGNYQVDFNEILGRDGDWHLINSNTAGTGEFPFPYDDAFELLP